jgi:hypothetical protein
MVRSAVTIMAAAAIIALCVAKLAKCGTYYIHPDGAITRGLRWDAAPRVFGGNERSLDGGLRYSFETGDYEAFRDKFTWSPLPSVTEFQQAIEQAFAAWELPDPVTGLATSIHFVADLNTAVVGSGVFGTGNANGAEIDLIAINLGMGSPRAAAFVEAVNVPVTLTSGTVAYAGSSAIIGADITINSSPTAVYSIHSFRRLLTHEIGHTIGLADVDTEDQRTQFVDDNYDGTTSATALATLTNSWSLAVDPLNPAASPLTIFHVPDADPGTDTPGVDILMESGSLGTSVANPLTNLFPLRNDDYNMRQFLYPSLTFAFTPGDFNHDGAVDAADYIKWRDELGTTYVASDYEIWRAYFGTGMSASVTANNLSQIPEPPPLTTWVLAAATILACATRKRRLSSDTRPARPQTGSRASPDRSLFPGRGRGRRSCYRAA